MRVLIQLSKRNGIKWARQATYTRNNNSYAELVNINSDSKGNIHEMGTAIGKIIFGPDTLFGDNTYLVKYDSAGNVKWASQSTLSGHYNLSVVSSSVTDK